MCVALRETLWCISDAVWSASSGHASVSVSVYAKFQNEPCLEGLGNRLKKLKDNAVYQTRAGLQALDRFMYY